MVGKICTVCRNCSFINKNMSFFTYPGDSKRRYEWLKAVGRLDLAEKLENNKTRSNHRICELHFEEKYMKITKAPKNLDIGRRKVLTKDAFPTLNLDSVPEEKVPEKLKPKKRPLRDESKRMEYSIKIVTPKDLEAKESKQIPSDIVSSFCESVIKTSVATQTYNKCYCTEENKNKTDLDQIQTKILEVFKDKDESCSNLKPVLKQCQFFLPKSLSTLIQWQLDSKHTGHNDYINYLALNLYYLKHPYKLLKKFLNLPNTSSLKQYLIPKSTNIYDNLKLFSIKVNHMSDKERICSVAVTCVKVSQNLYYNIKYDRIIGFLDVNGRQIFKPAEIAIVLVAQGIFDTWIQPVSYALFSDDYNENVISNWIDEVLIQLLNIGLDVKAFVSNLQFRYACSKKITPEQCYFTLNGRNIYYIYDVMQITEYASAKISEISKQSNSLIPDDVIVELKLINFFNTNTVKCDGSAKLLEAKEIMKQLICLQNNDIFIMYALVTINSIINISEHMNEVNDIFLTKNLLSLSNYLNRFNILRLNHECTAREINKFFVNTFVNNMLKMPIRRKVNSNNLDIYIQDLLTKDIKTINNHRPSLKVFTIDYRNKLSARNSFPHVCEYLYQKCLDQHYCSVLKIIHKTKEKTPPIAFSKFVKELENVFSHYFKMNYEIASDIGHSLLREMSSCTFDMPCFCFPIDYLKTLFIRAKLYYMIRNNNRLFKQTNDKLFKVCKIANFRIHSK